MNERIVDILIHAVILFTAFPVHEFSHAFAAHLMGDDTAKEQGRMTVNPLKHLDLWGTLLMLFAGFGWAKPVPINPNNFKNRKVGMALSSLAGPMSNLIMAYISIILYKVIVYNMTDASGVVMDALSMIFMYGVFLNVCLAVFNLLPIPPLDGSRIFTLIFPEKLYFKIMKYENIIFGVLFVAIFFGLLDKPLSILQKAAINTMDVLSLWVNLLFN